MLLLTFQLEQYLAAHVGTRTQALVSFFFFFLKCSKVAQYAKQCNTIQEGANRSVIYNNTMHKVK